MQYSGEQKLFIILALKATKGSERQRALQRVDCAATLGVGVEVVSRKSVWCREKYLLTSGEEMNP